MARQRISSTVGGAQAINNTILEAKELGENPLLPMGVQTLISQLCEAFLISQDEKLLEL
jgi:hypothetical protein